MSNLIEQLDISEDLANKLGHYVYAYIDPRTNRIFYIGKGVGKRAISHLSDKTDSKKVTLINEIFKSGNKPRIDILTYQLRDDLEASRVETALIDLLGLDNLTNSVRGLHSVDFPRRPLKDMVLEFSPKNIDSINIPSLLIRINREFRYGMSDEELYECTRGTWVIGERRNQSKFAMAVYDGVVREVYAIDSWHPAGTTKYKTRNQAELAKLQKKRWEFCGKIAPEFIREKYIGGSVAHFFQAGQQNPIVGIGL